MALAAAAVGIATVALVHQNAYSGPISEFTQQQRDLSNGAVKPLDGDRDCPAADPIKANYRSDRNTRYYFTKTNPYYGLTTPTSCWTTAAAAQAGGYRAP